MFDTVNFVVHGCNHQKKGIINKTISQRTGESLFLVPSHADLYHALHTVKNKVFTRVRLFNQNKIFDSPEASDIELNNLTSMQNNEHNFSLNKIEIVSAEYVKERNLKTFGKWNVTSSEYHVTYIIDPNKGTISFNVSIPKYLYGHNLAQFIPQYNSSTYAKYNTMLYDWDFQKNLAFERLMKFTKLFFYELFLTLEIIDKPNFEYIEINRLDICYNQYFKSYDESMYYLSLQKKLAKKKKQYSIKHDPDFETSLAFNTQNGYYFKIYNKGAEYINFKHGDFSNHQKINNAFIDKHLNKVLLKYTKTSSINLNDFEPYGTNEREKKGYENKEFDYYKNQIKTLFRNDTLKKTFDIDKAKEKLLFKLANEINKKLPFDTVYLRSEMDKVLRYEASLKLKFMAYKYNNYLFRKNCKIYQRAKEQYREVKRGLNNVDRFDYRPLNYKKRNYDIIHNFLSSTSSFVLSKNYNLYEHGISSKYDYDKKNDLYNISKFYDHFRKGTLLEKKHVFTFSKPLLNLLINNFRQTILDFQIKKLEPQQTLEKRVLEYNKQVDININSLDFNYYMLSERQQKRYDKLREKYNENAISFQLVYTEKEKLEKGLQKMSYTNLRQIFELLYDEKLSIHQIRKKLKLTNSQYYRRLKYLKMLGYDESSLDIESDLKPRTDFMTYYLKTSSSEHQKSFYQNFEQSKLS